MRKSLIPAVLGFPILSLSQEVVLEKLQVTATREERKEKDIPAGVYTVTEEEIETKPGVGTYELLQGISGVQATTRNGGYDVRLIIRGGGLKAPYAVREINILLDGVPITDPDGLTRLDFVDTQMLEQIDIVKGPNSTLYGANSAGGVVNFITVSPFKFQGFKLKMGYGSYNTYMFNLLYGGNVKGEVFYNVSTSYKKSDSWREWNRFESFKNTLKLGFIPDPGSTLEMTFNFSKADLQLPGPLTKGEFERDPSQQTSEPWRKSGRYSRIFFWSGKYEREVSRKLKLKSVLYLQRWTHYHPVTARIVTGGSYVGGTDTQVNYRHSLLGRSAELIAGIQIRYNHYNSKRYAYKYCKLSGGYDLCSNSSRTNTIEYAISDDKGELADEQKNRNLMWGVFAQETLRPTERTIVDLGIRFDQVIFDIKKDTYVDFAWGRNYYRNVSETRNTRKTFNAFSPRIGLTYRLFSFLNAYVSVSTGFQTPQDNEVLTNPDLKPARIINYEAGLKGSDRERFTFSTAVFYSDVRDEIVYSILGSGERTYLNAGRTEKKGFELDGKIRLFGPFVVGGAFSYFDFKYKEFTEYVRRGSRVYAYNRSGNKLPYIPEYMYSLYLQWWAEKGLRFRIDTNTWGPYYVDNANTEKYSDYKFITNLTLGYGKGDKFALYFDVNNIFDKKYAATYQKDIRGRTRIYPAPPRTYTVRVSYKF